MAGRVQERNRLAQERQHLSDDLSNLERNMRNASRELVRTHPGVAKKLRDALTQMDDFDLDNHLQRTADWLRRGIDPNANGTESQVAPGLEQLNQQLQDAQKAVGQDKSGLTFTEHASFYEVRERAKSLGIQIVWDCELPKTPEGFYQIQGGINYAIAKSMAAAPFADVLWMETKTADLKDARKFAEAIHTKYPDKMLAYNLSPSFNWDTTGMSDEEMKRFPEELGKLGYVFNFITYGGHQIDGVAAEEFARALKEDGMLGLARLQRNFRLLDSPYRTPQTLVGGPRLDGALMASSGRTVATKAMGKGSTQFQHLVQTEVPVRLLEQWLATWRKHWEHSARLRVELRPHTAGSELLELRVIDESSAEKLANITFSNLQDRYGRNFLSVRPEQSCTPAQETNDDACAIVLDPPL